MFRKPDPVLQPAERRDERRRVILKRARVELPGTTRLSVHAVDLSRDGVGLQTTMALPVGQELKIILPLEVDGESLSIELFGQVRNCRQYSETRFRIGVQFVDLDETAASLLQVLCAE